MFHSSRVVPSSRMKKGRARRLLSVSYQLTCSSYRSPASTYHFFHGPVNNKLNMNLLWTTYLNYYAADACSRLVISKKILCKNGILMLFEFLTLSVIELILFDDSGYEVSDLCTSNIFLVYIIIIIFWEWELTRKKHLTYPSRSIITGR